MALGYSPVGAPKLKDRSVVDITTDATYAAGGYVISAANCGVPQVVGMTQVGGPAGFKPMFNPSTGKLMFFKTGSATSAALLEAANNEAGLSGVVWRFEVIG